MAKKKTAAITGVGAYLPDYILDNIELSQMVDTSDEWIMSRIGIKTRHILKGEGLGTSFMGEKAVLDLLEKTNTDPMDIEMVICATVTPDMFFPSTANLICYKTGMKQAFGFDLSAACSGFLFALNTASKYTPAAILHRPSSLPQESLHFPEGQDPALKPFFSTPDFHVLSSEIPSIQVQWY